jgi:hypothetical protein
VNPSKVALANLAYLRYVREVTPWLLADFASSISAMCPSAWYRSFQRDQDTVSSTLQGSTFPKLYSSRYLHHFPSRSSSRTLLPSGQYQSVFSYAGLTSPSHSLASLDVGSNIGTCKQPQHRLPVDTNCNDTCYSQRFGHWLATSRHHVTKHTDIGRSHLDVRIYIYWIWRPHPRRLRSQTSPSIQHQNNPSISRGSVRSKRTLLLRILQTTVSLAENVMPTYPEIQCRSRPHQLPALVGPGLAE